jgi:hypothetical protein
VIWPPLDILIVSVLMFGLTISGQTLIRKKHWAGWVISLCQQIPFNYLTWRTGTWGYTLLSSFYIYNAIQGIRSWRKSRRRPRRAPRRVTGCQAAAFRKESAITAFSVVGLAMIAAFCLGRLLR